jgi:hypothetical protein
MTQKCFVGALAALLLAACNQSPSPTPIVIVVTVVTNASPLPATITPVPTETTPPTALPTLAPTLTTRPGRPTRTPIIIPIYSPTAPPPTATPAPPPQITEWRGEYFNNLSLIGQPVVVRNDRDVDFDWLTGSPDPRINLDLFSARWSRSLLFEAGTYRFGIRVDDGVRLFVDGVLVLDDWRDGVRDASVDLTLARGNHNLRVEYYERGGRASIQMSIARLIILPPATPAPTAPPPPPTKTPTAIPQPTSTALPTQPPPPPPFTRTPTSIPDDTSTPIPPTPIPSTPTRPNPTATPLPPTPTLTPILNSVITAPNVNAFKHRLNKHCAQLNALRARMLPQSKKSLRFLTSTLSHMPFNSLKVQSRRNVQAKQPSTSTKSRIKNQLCVTG